MQKCQLSCGFNGASPPTRAVCSMLIAPEILHVRHHCLFAPRDFDVPPCFDAVKPTLANGFDRHPLSWGAPGASTAPDQASKGSPT